MENLPPTDGAHKSQQDAMNQSEKEYFVKKLRKSCAVKTRSDGVTELHILRRMGIMIAGMSLSKIVLAYHVQSPKFNPQHCN